MARQDDMKQLVGVIRDSARANGPGGLAVALARGGKRKGKRPVGKGSHKPKVGGGRVTPYI